MDAFNAHRQSWFEQQRQRKQQLRDKLFEQKKAERQRQAVAEAERNQQADQQRLQAEKEATEAAIREAELAQMQPLEREIAEYRLVSEAIKALQGGHWQDEAQSQAAGYLKARMQREKCWKENSAKKNPAKDKVYQRTLIVKGYL